MKKALLLIALSLTVNVALATESYDSSVLPKFLFQSKNSSGAFKNDNLFEITNPSGLDEAKAFYKGRPLGFKLPENPLVNLNFERLNNENVALTMLSKLFASGANQGKKYELPFVFYMSDELTPLRVVDGIYAAGPCKGMGYFEAYFKDKCEVSPRMPLFDGSYKLLLDNDLFDYNLYRTLPKLFGLKSNAGPSGFSSILSPLDTHLYSHKLGRLVLPLEKYSQIFSSCMSDACKIFEFKGENVARVGNFNDLDEYDDDFPLFLHLKDDGSCEFTLRNTLLSNSEYVNYDFYSEIELAVLNDLGYDFDPRRFYGNSIYTSGFAELPRNIVLNRGYFYWDRDLKSYDNDKLSSVPLSVGTHIYGNYNNVRQVATIASVGYGATGVRIDGVGNSLIIPKNTAILENGEKATGIAVRYGSNTTLGIKGYVSASRRDGIAVSLDFKGNMRSDFHEYQGSFVRVRTGDYESGKSNEIIASTLKLPEAIKGPLVKRLNVSGTLIGKKAAIYIGDTAWVEEINFLDRATVRGDIISDYDPYVEGDWIYIWPKNSSLLPGRFQYKPNSTFLDYKGNKNFIEKLYTRLTFGGVSQGVDPLSQNMGFFDSNHKAIIDINGNIKGRNLILDVLGGITSQRGDLDVKRLMISNASLHLNSNHADAQQVEALYLDSGGALNLANGRKNTFRVLNRAYIAQDSVIKVDTDELGQIMDTVRFHGQVASNSTQIHIEPCLSYNQVKHFNADPKAFFNYISRFVVNANIMLAPYKLSVHFPNNLWYKSGVMGRKIKCTARGCRIGDFVGNRKSNFYEKLPAWRIYLSLGGCVFLIVLTIFARGKIKPKAKGQKDVL